MVSASEAPNHTSISQPNSTCSRSTGGEVHSIAINKTDNTMKDPVAPATSSTMRVAMTSMARTLRWYSRLMFWWMALLQRPTVLRQTSTDEYPVMAKATMGIADPWPNPAAAHKAATPTVKIIGSPTNHSTPRLSRPNRVITSRINSAPITRR
jgi:hypothetical protein